MNDKCVNAAAVTVISHEIRGVESTDLRSISTPTRERSPVQSRDIVQDADLRVQHLAARVVSSAHAVNLPLDCGHDRGLAAQGEKSVVGTEQERNTVIGQQ